MEHTPSSPPASANLERRCKRQAWAQEHQFFAVTAPGLEGLCAAELIDLGAGRVEPLAGGVAFAGRLELLYRANLRLSTAGRVLLRLKDFRVRTWEDLLRQAAAVPWEVWLAPGAPLKVLATLRQSNLRHEGRIAEEVLAAAGRRLVSLGLEPPHEAAPEAADPAMVMVRGQDRRASLSLDSSGPHLHRRGYRLAPGQAPLREDLAAALLRLAGYDGSQTLLDPMCGSGTIAAEAGLLARGLPPGLDRSFALESWPCFRAATWTHLRKQARQEALQRLPQPILARDMEEAAIRAAAANLERAGLAGQVELERADFFAAPPPAGPPGVLAMNPPFGRRLGSVRQARDFAARLGRKLRADYAGWRCAVVLYRPEWEELLGLKAAARLVVPHGGLTVTLLAGQVPDGS